MNTYNPNTLETDIVKLLMDDDVTKRSGIIEYVLSPRKKIHERFLNIREFTKSRKNINSQTSFANRLLYN
jgi:hypothetical protein